MGDDNSLTLSEMMADIQARQKSHLRNPTERNLKRLLQREEPNRLVRKMRREGGV